MIYNKGILNVPFGIEYISDWVDENGINMLDHYFCRGKFLLNKQLTGCGFTTYCLSNHSNMILVSPRIRLIQDKLQQFSGCYYFDKEKEHKKTEKDLTYEFGLYYQMSLSNNTPMKILVTYDSFCSLMNMLESTFGINIDTTFRIAIDESHCLIKDVSMKENHNKNTLSSFLARLFQYENLLYASATPIVDYISQIPEFQMYQVDYYELAFPQTTAIRLISDTCRGSLNAFDRIYDYYDKHVDPQGRHYFDAINYGVGKAEYSYEAVIFLNSVKDIQKILKKYVKEKKVFKASDITIVCANTPENRKIISSICPGAKICEKIPKKGDLHTIITLVTRTGFEGVDFCSTNASTYVIANYNIRSLSLDIASDLPQIVGRQRLPENHFRDTIHMYYTNGKDSVTDEEFDADIKRRMDNSNNQIRFWNDTAPQYKDMALSNLNAAIDKQPNDYCLMTFNGKPEINYLILANEKYCKDILQTYQSLIIKASASSNTYSQITKDMIYGVQQVFSEKTTHDRIALVYQYFTQYPELHSEFFQALREYGFNDIGKYFNLLPLGRIYAHGFDTWKMDREINSNVPIDAVNAIRSCFIPGEVYGKKEIKEAIQSVYDSFGIKKVAKAKEIEEYMSVALAKKNGINAYRIVG